MKTFRELVTEAKKSGKDHKHHARDEKDDGYRRTKEGHIIIDKPIHFKHIDGEQAKEK